MLFSKRLRRGVGVKTAFMIFSAFFPALSGCASIPPPSPVPPLRYPVILVNGLALRDGKGAGAWGRIPAFLQSCGIDLYFGGTDAWGLTETNAELLKVRVEEVLRETGRERVNIIAHSAGGIDSRYMIWNYDMGARVASLTTLATPHQGAELADFIYEWKITHSSFIRKLFMRIGRIQGDRRPAPYERGRSLTREEMKEFNARVPPDPRVYYLSIYSAMEDCWDDPLFGLTRRYLNRKAGPNDGIVTEESTLWYGEWIKAGNGISHLEILDYRGNRSGDDILKIYTGLIDKLRERGF